MPQPTQPKPTGSTQAPAQPVVQVAPRPVGSVKAESTSGLSVNPNAKVDVVPAGRNTDAGGDSQPKDLMKTVEDQLPALPPADTLHVNTPADNGTDEIFIDLRGNLHHKRDEAVEQSDKK